MWSFEFASFWDFGCRIANSLPIPRMQSSLEFPATEEALRRNVGTVLAIRGETAGETATKTPIVWEKWGY